MGTTIISEEKLQHIIEKRLHSTNVKIIKCEFQPLSQVREGFLGDHFRLQINYEKDSVPGTEHFFCKVLCGDSEKSKATTLNAYPKETFLMSYLCPEYEKRGIDISFAPRCDFTDDTNCILEDLSLSNYKTLPFQTGCTFDQAKAVVEALAKFHAASIIFEEVKSKEIGKTFRLYDEFSAVLKDTMFSGTIGNAWLRNTQKICQHAIEVENSFDEKTKQKVLDVFNQICDNLCINGISPLKNFRNVIVHNDLWSNNIMLREENSQVQCRLIDFQLVNYFNPFYDVFFFLFANTSHSLRKTFKEILNAYWNVFSEQLAFHGIKTEKLFPKNILVSLCKDALTSAKARSLMCTVFMQMPLIPNRNVSFDTVLDDSGCEMAISDFNEFADYREFISNEIKEIKTILFDEFLENLGIDFS